MIKHKTIIYIGILKKYKYIVLALSIAGFLFSGYLSAIKFFNQICAFNEGCPYFLGYPACYFGFIMFTSLFILSLLNLILKTKGLIIIKSTILISFLGILFAGYFTTKEIYYLFTNNFSTNYTLILPTCAYGLIFYVLVFVFSYKILKYPKKETTGNQA